MKLFFDLLDREMGRVADPQILRNAKEGTIYLKRWQICQDGNFSVYMHRFLGDDPRQTLHPHTKWMMTIGLWGSYIEQTEEGEREFHAPWVRVFDHTHRHRIRMKPGTECWTLCIGSLNGGKR